MEGPLSLRERQNIAQEFRGENLSTLHLRGQDLYRQKQYEAALQCFTEVRTRQRLSTSQLMPLP